MSPSDRPVTHRPARLNRGLLAAVGTLLLAAGAFVLALGLALLPLDPTVPLLPDTTTVTPWAPWATVATAVVVGLGALRWLLAQAQRRPSGTTWALPTAPGSRTRIRSDVAAAAVAADVTGYRGVAKATAALTGPRDRACLVLTVHTETGTQVGPLRARITDHALPRLRTSMGLLTLPTDLLLRLDATDGNRAR